MQDVHGAIQLSGTILATSRTNPAKREGGLDEVTNNLKRYGFDALVAIGGDDTLGVAAVLAERGLNVVGVPKTIDNDIPLTDFCIGFDTAANVVAEALDRLQGTARSHMRTMVVEVMGRESGWLAIVGGMAGGADFITIPEVPVSIDDLIAHVTRRLQSRRFSVIVIAEGTEVIGLEKAAARPTSLDEFGHVRLSERGIAQRVADQIEHVTGVETRVTVLGHLQRGGTPTVRDRYMSILIGSAAVDFLHRGLAGSMTAVKGHEIVPIRLSEIVGKTNLVPPQLYEMGSRFFLSMAAPGTSQRRVAP
jgi:6-phosphofructokinase 1